MSEDIYIKKVKLYDAIFASLMGVIGFGYTYLSVHALNAVSVSCSNSSIKVIWALIEALGICIIVGSLMYWFCRWKSDNCYTNINIWRPIEKYIVWFGVCSLTIAILAGTLFGTYKKLNSAELIACDTSSDNKQGENDSFALCIFAGICTLGAVIALWFKSRQDNPEPDIITASGPIEEKPVDQARRYGRQS